MKAFLISIALLTCIWSFAGIKVLTFSDKGESLQQPSIKKVSSIEGEYALHWQDMPHNTTINIQGMAADWQAEKVLIARIYSVAATNQVIYIAAYSDSTETDGPDYFKVPFTVDWTGWKTLAIPLAQFRPVRQPVGWHQIDSVRLAAHWNKVFEDGTEIYLQSIKVGKVTQLAGIFSDNMVLQRNRTIKIWGWDDPGQTLSVALADDRVFVTADENGRFVAELPSRSEGGPYKVIIDGSISIKLDNIMVGDVWFCSGQSNMGMKVKDTLNAKQEMAAAEFPSIRLYTVDREMALTPLDDVRGQWDVCSPTTIKNFSAAAYYFAREIRQHENIPLGLINCSWGGTQAEAWMSAEAIAAIPEAEEIRKEEHARYDEIKTAYDAWEDLRRQYKHEGKDLDQLPDKPRKTHCIANVLYNAMVHPLNTFPVRGVIWYQGESNARNAELYERLFKGLITDWRDKRHNPELPFYYVQLANYRDREVDPSESNWSIIREAQRQALNLPFTGMALAIDVGEADDIHPKNKQAVGKRLALHALKHQYGHALETSGPLPEKAIRQDATTIAVSFKHIAGGLETHGELAGFALQDTGGLWHWAEQAEIAGNQVILRSNGFEPQAVRYGWAINPIASLYNDADLPATPFELTVTAE